METFSSSPGERTDYLMPGVTASVSGSNCWMQRRSGTLSPPSTNGHREISRRHRRRRHGKRPCIFPLTVTSRAFPVHRIDHGFWRALSPSFPSLSLSGRLVRRTGCICIPASTSPISLRLSVSLHFQIPTFLFVLLMLHERQDRDLDGAGRQKAEAELLLGTRPRRPAPGDPLISAATLVLPCQTTFFALLVDQECKGRVTLPRPIRT